MKNLLTTALLLGGVVSLSAAANDAPRWLRDVAISPDGKTIAFTYKGDIYTVPSAGGHASQLTTNSAYDSAPVWRPDGKQIVFRSNRNGSDDLYIIPAVGGTARRLTTHSGQETPLTFKDNSTLLFSANIAPGREAIQGPFAMQTYTIDVDSVNPRPRMYLSVPMGAAAFSSDGRLLYQDKKGFENIWRKHERSSGTSDIWMITPDDGKFTKITTFNGHDLNPVWNGGDTFFYVSEEGDNTLNIFSSTLDGKQKRQLTHFSKHPVRSLSADAAGRNLAFSWDGEIWTMTPGEEPQKLNVEIITDDYDADQVKRYVSGGASNIAVSPSGDEVAFILRGDLYVTNTKYETTKRITNTPGQERCVSFSPDGRTLVYDSERDGVWQLFTTKIVSPDEKQFAYATDIVEEPLYRCETAAQQPEFSPDGKKVAFLENRTALRVIDLDTKEVTTALDGKFNYSYTDGDISFAWSPDSRWLLADYIGIGGWNNTDIALCRADGSEVIDLTESGYADSNPKWGVGGKALTYTTGKYGMKSHGSWGNQSDVIVMFLDTEGWDNYRISEEEKELLDKKKKDEDSAKSDEHNSKKKDKKKKKGEEASEPDVKPLEFDLRNRKYRMSRLTPSSAFVGDYYLSPEADKFYYVATATEGGANLLVRDLRKEETKVLARGVSGGLLPDKKGENLFYLSGGGIKRVKLPSGEIEPVKFEALYERTPSGEREYIFDHMWKQVKDKFYDANLHGVDWEGYGQHYRELLPYIDNNRDFAILLSEILGELNASHTGSGTSSGWASLQMSDLGAFYDETYDGDGLMVAEILPRSPLSAKSVDVRPGDLILSIDGEKIVRGHDYYPLLEGKAGRNVRVGVRRQNGHEEEVTLKPMNAGQVNSVLYQRWVERNQAMVDSLSGGRLGYVHIEGMNTESFQTIYDQLLGKYRNREAVIVDTRWNGGGWLHNDVAQLLSGREYVRFVPRGQYIGSEPFSQWTKPSVMLVNESNYSDAHGTPFTYQTLGIGDVVGAPVPGTMTAVWWETQIDPSIYFGIPQVTSMDLEGNILENHQLTPDVLIYNNPGDVIEGRDSQIEGAVNHLMKKLDAAK
ncbi:MAG: S41 family peptidase [Clostridium sp.]|nr:S41 family peptidase [Clostridium sp.]